MKRFILILIFLGLIAVFVGPGRVFAAESIGNFDVHLIAQRNGDMVVTETIQYDFDGDMRHGIYREIPLVTKVGDSLQRVISLNVNSVTRDGQVELFAVSSSDQLLEIKIGDPNQTLTGMHTYTIKYMVTNGIGSNYSDHDEIYWNVTGNAWQVPIEKSSIVLGTDFGTKPGKMICFTGVVGSKASNCLVSDVSDAKKTQTTGKLSVGEGLSVVSAFSAGTFPKSSLEQVQSSSSVDAESTLRLLGVVYVLLNCILAPGLIFWYWKYKRKKKTGAVAVNFDLPKDTKGMRLSPAEAGTIDTAKLDKNDLTATIFDLAIRKYIRIEQISEKKSVWPMGAKDDYQLVKLKSFEDLNHFEKRLTKMVFGGKEKVLLSEVKIEYADTEELETENFTSLMARGFYTKNPAGQMGALLGVGIFCLITLNLLLGGVLVFLSKKLTGRTQLGDAVDLKIDGLKLFLKNMSRNYTWQAEKAYVVEQMIPYAMALGYIETYMKQLKILHPNYQPGWYVGQSTFWVMYPGFHESFSSAVVTSAPSSSSGFSGGGFSGGGGGGGGGGSW